MKKKTVADSIVGLGKTLERIPFAAVVTFVLALTVVLLAQTLSKIVGMGLYTYVIITITFLFGTGILALLIQIGAIIIGKLLIWIGTRKIKKFPAKLELSVKQNGKDFYLVIYNAERWYKAKNVFVEWDRFVATPKVSDELFFRSFSEWNKNNEKLHWVLDKSTKKNNAIAMDSKKSKEALLFRLNKERNEFCIMAINREPLYFPMGRYTFHLSVHVNMPRRFPWLSVLIGIEFKTDGQMEINSVQIES